MNAALGQFDASQGGRVTPVAVSGRPGIAERLDRMFGTEDPAVVRGQKAEYQAGKLNLASAGVAFNDGAAGFVQRLNGERNSGRSGGIV